ncbi:MAG TPA: polysaccharide deacetylase family protein [Candidatus Polarisedimenticolia bacterium]|nr:polysaccharide deacetylase family protein [Candidatus Polarisedimenticolia bacterium]
MTTGREAPRRGRRLTSGLAAVGLAALCAGRVLGAGPAPARPILITVDDLPLASPRLHPDAAERSRITGELLAALERHRVPAVGFVIWGQVRTDDDRAILRAWLGAGHELGNHSAGHLDHDRTGSAAYIEDLEKGRAGLERFLRESSPGTAGPRLFRFPFLREGNTPAKLEAARLYLQRSGQRNVPVTIDNQDWSFEEPYVEARRAGDRAAMETARQDYLAALRLAVRHHERRGDAMAGREVPQILLLHANEVGAACWDDLFRWLVSTGHRFAPAAEVLADPALAEEPRLPSSFGMGLWDRLGRERRIEKARTEAAALLARQAEAWNRGDLEAFCSVYSEEALFASPSGLAGGRAAVLERYRARYAGREAMGRLTLELVQAAPAEGTDVTPHGDAVPGRIQGMSVLARWRLERERGEASSGLTQLFLRPSGGTWEIVHDASMPSGG